MFFEQGTCVLKKGDRHYTIHSLRKAANKTEQDAVSVENLMLSVAQAKRFAKAGGRSFTAMVSTVQQHNTTGPDSTEPELSAQIADVQQQYSDLFQTPAGLPPDRGIEHVIPLLPDSQPPYPRMYRLSPSDMQEVRQNVTELLQKGLIEPSTSSFGAPILLFNERKTKHFAWLLTTEH